MCIEVVVVEHITNLGRTYTSHPLQNITNLIHTESLLSHSLKHFRLYDVLQTIEEQQLENQLNPASKADRHK